MFTTDRSVLLVIDVQGKLAQLMYERDRVVRNIQAMIKAAQILDIPILWTEQVPEKIGPTIDEIASLLHYLKPIRKKIFSCYLEKAFADAFKKINRRQVIICGIETHVCVYQTVADLAGHKFDVQVVADAVSSRTKENRELGLAHIRGIGAALTCTEMIICELLRTSEHPKFKDVLSLIK